MSILNFELLINCANPDFSLHYFFFTFRPLWARNFCPSAEICRCNCRCTAHTFNYITESNQVIRVKYVAVYLF